MYLYLNVLIIIKNIDLKFDLTMATNRSHKEVTSKTKYEVLIEEVRNRKEGQTKTFPTGLTLLPVPFQPGKKTKTNFIHKVRKNKSRNL